MNPLPIGSTARRGSAAVGLALALLAAPGTRAADEWKPLAGASLHVVIKGAQLTDGYHYTYRYGADGTLSGTQMAREIQGSWHVEGKALCMERVKPRPARECLQVERNGHELRMMQDNGLVVLQGQISPMRSPATAASRGQPHR